MQVEPRIARAIIGALRERDLSGHEIWQWLGAVHGASAELTERTLYPTLYSLEADGLLESYWREGEVTRRAYRIAGSGLDAALANAWPPIPKRRGPAVEVDRSTRGGDPAQGDTLELEEAAPPPASREALAEHEIAGYLEELAAHLTIDDLHGRDARLEIGDHLRDATAEYHALGNETDDAAACAIDGLGPPESLAAAMSSAQQSRKRFTSGLRWGAAVATTWLLGVLALVVSVLFIVVPLIFLAAHALTALAGLDAYLPTTAAVDETSLLLPADIAAFVAARRTITEVALRSRRSESMLWPVWSLIGIVPLAPLALLLPITHDPVTLAAALGLPLAWVGGCLRPMRLGGSLVTAGGAIAVVAVIVIGLTAPGVHLWTYSHSGLPPTAPPEAAIPGLRVVWSGDDNKPVWAAELRGLPDGWSAPRIDVWRTVRQGISIVLDPSATAPAASFDRTLVLDYRGVPGDGDAWLVLISAADPGGVRHTLSADVRLGLTQFRRGSILEWLLNGG